MYRHFSQTPLHFLVLLRRSSTFPQLIGGFIGFLVRYSVENIICGKNPTNFEVVQNLIVMHSSFLLKFGSYVQQPHFAEVNRVQSFGVLYQVVNKNHQKVLHIHHLYHFLSP